MTPQALRHADRAVALRERIERDRAQARERHETLKARLADELLQANRSGATYDELVEHTGVSDGWLCQLIRSAKTATSRSGARARRARTSSAA